MGYYMGIDLGGTRIKGCVTTHEGDIVTQTVISTDPHSGQQAVLDRALRLSEELLAKAKVRVNAIGVGICGPTNVDKGILITSPILVGWNNVPLRDIFQDRLAIQTIIDNDANLAILGETFSGVAKGARNVIGFTVGTGVGGAVIIDGNIYRGSHWYGGELGHMTVKPNGHPCPCGNRGCLTVEASSKRIIERYAQFANCSSVTLKEVFNLAKENDRQAYAAVIPMVEALAIGVANVLNVFDPDYVVIAGGPTRTGRWLLELLIENVHGKVFGDLSRQVRVEFANLDEWAGAIGAAGFAYQFFSQKH